MDDEEISAEWGKLTNSSKEGAITLFKAIQLYRMGEQTGYDKASINAAKTIKKQMEQARASEREKCKMFEELKYQDGFEYGYKKGQSELIEKLMDEGQREIDAMYRFIAEERKGKPTDFTEGRLEEAKGWVALIKSKRSSECLTAPNNAVHEIGLGTVNSIAANPKPEKPKKKED